MLLFSPFTQSESVPEHATEKAYSAVMDAITQNTRFELVDRRELDKLAEEKAFQQSSEDAKNTFKLESGELTGAAYYITGNVTEYFTFPADRKAKKYFKASYKVQLRFINIQTGKIMYSELLTARNSANVALGGKDYRAHRDDPITFEIKNYKLFSYPTEVLAKQDIERVIPELTKDFVENLLVQVFPIYYKVLGVSKTNKKGHALEVTMLGGSRSYVEVDENYRVVEVTKVTVGGQETERSIEIGRAKPYKIEGPDFSVAKITKGGSEIATKLSEGANIRIVR